jgi:hypothetical protein
VVAVRTIVIQLMRNLGPALAVIGEYGRIIGNTAGGDRPVVEVQEAQLPLLLAALVVDADADFELHE